MAIFFRAAKARSDWFIPDKNPDNRSAISYSFIVLDMYSVLIASRIHSFSHPGADHLLNRKILACPSGSGDYSQQVNNKFKFAKNQEPNTGFVLTSSKAKAHTPSLHTPSCRGAGT